MRKQRCRSACASLLPSAILNDPGLQPGKAREIRQKVRVSEKSREFCKMVREILNTKKVREFHDSDFGCGRFIFHFK